MESVSRYLESVKREITEQQTVIFQLKRYRLDNAIATRNNHTQRGLLRKCRVDLLLQLFNLRGSFSQLLLPISVSLPIRTLTNLHFIRNMIN